jgi:predicted DNA-binding protein
MPKQRLAGTPAGKSPFVSARVPTPVAERIAALAAERGVERSTVVRELLERALREEAA